jgi:NAD+ diphosphatase
VSEAPRRYAFRHPGLDRAEHLREDAATLDAHWPLARVLIVDAEGQARFDGTPEAPDFPHGGRLSEARPEQASFLGLDETGLAWFAMPGESLAELPVPALDLRSAAARWPALQASVFAQARALLHWQQRSRHCGACGQALQLGRAGYCARCPQCGLENYPRTDPAIIVAVSDGGRLLLGRQASWPEKRWSVLAGFMEPGESLEQTVAREVLEEAGVRIRECRYAGSQPWPFPAALMLAFHAEADVQPVVVGDELQDARWFAADELRALVASGEVLLSPSLSISRWLIEDWLARH